MIRYFVVATAFVFTFILTLLALGRIQTNSGPPTPYASTVVPAGSPRAEGLATTTAVPVSGVAPWALTALPECFHQVHHVSGTSNYVAYNYPKPPSGNWTPVVASVLVTADCRLMVEAPSGTVEVVRGDTHLRLPRGTQVYVSGSQFLLNRYLPGASTRSQRFDSLEDLRVYVLRDGANPNFVAQ